jgi:hypothetical protein
MTKKSNSSNNKRGGKHFKPEEGEMNNNASR